MTSSANKRIVTNTIHMYVRMFVTMLTTLYTSRIVLGALGAEDFGLNNVVAGLVTIFAFMSGAISAASARFFAYNLSQNNNELLRRTFNTSLQIHLLITVVVFVLSETVGLWFVKNRLNIPIERLEASLVVYQISIVSCCLMVIHTPFSAIILARENAKIFAYTSLLESFLKLIVAFAIVYSPWDKLVVYSALNVVSLGLIYSVYIVYCLKSYPEVSFSYRVDVGQFKVMLSYSGWSLLSNFVMVVANQGGNILLNLFFGPAVNAANAVANQVNLAVTNFSNNFRGAINPQIIKSYASNDHKRLMLLMKDGTKITFYILLVVVAPVVAFANEILKFWLKSPPEGAAIFVQLVLILSLVQAIDISFATAIQATGRIRDVVLITVFLGLGAMGIVYALFRSGAGQEWLYLALIIRTVVIVTIMKPWIIKKEIGLGFKEIYMDILIPAFSVAGLSFAGLFWLRGYFNNSILSFILVAAINFMIVVVLTIGIGVSKHTRQGMLRIANAQIQAKLGRLKH